MPKVARLNPTLIAKALRRRVIVLAVVIGAIISFPSVRAIAFDVDGLRTGMSVSEAVSLLGTKMKRVSSGVTTAGHRSEIYWSDPSDTTGSVTSLVFCDGALVSILRNLDFDADYIPTLQDVLQKYATPNRVWVKRQPWTGPGGGYVSSSETEWTSGKDRVVLAFNPEGRGGTRALRYGREAGIDYETRSPCSGDLN